MRTILTAGGALVLASILVAAPALAQETKTAKERSSRKWFDEQRVDNCRVPAELRGTTPRPGCPDELALKSARPRESGDPEPSNEKIGFPLEPVLGRAESGIRVRE